MRGEHAGLSHLANTLAGSSPHARGAPILDLKSKNYDRIIPACAGSTDRAA